MTGETGPGFENYLHDEFRHLVQDAIDTTAQWYSDQGATDVMGRLRSELSNRGVEISDDAWLSEVAGMIRAGLPLVVGDSDDLSPGPEKSASTSG